MNFEKVKKRFGDDDFRLEGGQGTSVEDAIVISDPKNPAVVIFVERIFLMEIFGEEDSDWFLDRQQLLFLDDKAYDIFTLKMPDGRIGKIYFDVTSFFGSGTY